MMTLKTKKKFRETCLHKYGVEAPTQLPHVRKRLKDQDVIEKKYASYKAHKTFKSSAPERRFYELLLQRYDADDIEQQKHVPHTLWPIDFYVKSIDTWIQIDGEYWHGLDGKLDEHRQQVSESARSAMIVRKWEVDQEQKVWFKQRNMKLVRITDARVYEIQELPQIIDDVAYVCI